MGIKGVTAMVNTRGEINKTTDALGKINKVKYNTFGEAMEGIKRNLQTGILIPLGDWVLPALTKFSNWLIANMPIIRKNVGKAMDTIKEKFKIVSDWVKIHLLPVFKEIKNWCVKNFPAIKNAVMKAYNYIKPSFDKLVQAIKDDVMPIIMGLWDTVKKAMPGIKAIFKIAFPIIVAVVKTVIDIIVDVIKSVKGIYDFIKPGLDLVATIFSKTFGGIVNIIEKAYNWLHKWNKEPAEDKNISVTTTHYNQSRGASQFAIGSRYIPYDMVAKIHQGEMIVPKSENPYANSGNGKTMPNGGNGLSLNIENFANNRSQDIESLAEELSFYMKQKQTGGSQ